METIFITGATGFLGSYVITNLLREGGSKLFLLTRAQSDDEARAKLWKNIQIHMNEDEFWSHQDMLTFVPGDLTAPGLGINPGQRHQILRECDSVLHIAASLNRKSEKTCLNHNLRGTLSVINLAREIADTSGLRRFSHVSTVAVAGQRDSETVFEDTAIDWNRSDYDPYARTKKFCEHMVRELLPDVQKTFFRPSIVMGDSRFPQTTQFDMVRAFCVLADMPVLPFSGEVRLDIVNADWVGKAISTLHMKAEPNHEIYHLSSGLAARKAEEIAGLMTSGKRKPIFGSRLERPFEGAMNLLASSKAKNTATYIGSLFKVFMPYITFDTVFDNSRAVDELGEAPTPFPEYCQALYKFSKENDYKYPAKPLSRKPEPVKMPKIESNHPEARP